MRDPEMPRTLVRLTRYRVLWQPCDPQSAQWRLYGQVEFFALPFAVTNYLSVLVIMITMTASEYSTESLWGRRLKPESKCYASGGKLRLSLSVEMMAVPKITLTILRIGLRVGDN